MTKKGVFALSILIILYLAYAGIYIQRMSYNIEGHKYYLLMEDAMISMKYAKNLAEGKGLVWFAGGEKTEGITNPLWTVYMAVPHLLKIKPENTSLFIQVSAAIFLAVNIFLVFMIGLRFLKDEPMALLAAALTGFYFPLNEWSLMGMEVSIITMLISLAVYLTVKAMDEGKFNPWIFVICGVLPLIRIDQAVFSVVLTAYMAFADAANRKKAVIWGVSALAVSLVSQTIFRVMYYHDILPNTYYLKMTGYPLFLRMTRGLFFVLKNAVLSGVPALILVFIGLIRRKTRESILFLSLFLAQVAYSVYVGGDITEHFGGANRFYSISMPFFFLLCAGGIKSLADPAIPGDGWKLKKLALTTTAGAMLLLSVNMFLGPKSLEEFFLIKPMKLEKPLLEALLKRALIIGEVTTDKALIGVVAAGIPSYFNERSFTDLLGKADRHIAKMPMHLPDRSLGIFKKAIYFTPGHLKWDYQYSVVQKRPDLLTGLWWGADEISAFMKENYEQIALGMYVLKGSKNILWDKLEKYREHTDNENKISD